MAEFAETDFAYSAKGEDGHSKRDHLISAAEQGNKAAQQELDEIPKCPQATLYLWNYFLKLDAKRQSNGFGVLPLLISEMEAWFRLRRIKLDHWELDALDRLDTLYLASRVQAKGNPDNG